MKVTSSISAEAPDTMQRALRGARAGGPLVVLALTVLGMVRAGSAQVLPRDEAGKRGPRQFTSAMGFPVLDIEGNYLGETPRDKVALPRGKTWLVWPTRPQDLTEADIADVVREVRARSIPGLSLRG